MKWLTVSESSTRELKEFGDARVIRGKYDNMPYFATGMRCTLIRDENDPLIELLENPQLELFPPAKCSIFEETVVTTTKRMARHCY